MPQLFVVFAQLRFAKRRRRQTCNGLHGTLPPRTGQLAFKCQRAWVDAPAGVRSVTCLCQKEIRWRTSSSPASLHPHNKENHSQRLWLNSRPGLPFVPKVYVATWPGTGTEGSRFAISFLHLFLISWARRDWQFPDAKHLLNAQKGTAMSVLTIPPNHSQGATLGPALFEYDSIIPSNLTGGPHIRAM